MDIRIVENYVSAAREIDNEYEHTVRSYNGEMGGALKEQDMQYQSALDSLNEEFASRISDIKKKFSEDTKSAKLAKNKKLDTLQTQFLRRIVEMRLSTEEVEVIKELLRKETGGENAGTEGVLHQEE